MASDTIRTTEPPRFGRDSDPQPAGAGDVARKLVAPLASLKLTVALFALAIFIIFAGTLAQVDQDIWKVMRDYFRTPLAWIPLRVFKAVLPAEINIPGTLGFYFPGGFTIGLAMLLNLLAAHSLRFKAQSRGARLLGGLALIALGAVMTWTVIESGSNKEGIQDLAWFSQFSQHASWHLLWEVTKGILAAFAVSALVTGLRLGSPRRLERGLLLGFGAVLAVFTGWLYYRGDAAALGDSSLRILWQLMKGGLAGLVLLAGCILVFRKRAGVVLLHAGIGLMMINELVVHHLHVEGQMQIAEREATNYAQDIRKRELAVIDTSGPETDDVVVVPEEMLQAKGLIQHPDLPFDIQVLEYLQNSTIVPAEPGESNPADTGFGTSHIAKPLDATTGVDTDRGIDMTSAYVTLIDKRDPSKSLGTRLLGVMLSMKNLPEKAAVDGKTYDVVLRVKRDYKPYAMYLKDVRFDKYMGTNMAKNYSSELRLVDASRDVDRDVKIWMNNPLRYAGETFYQQNFDSSTGVEVTVLQVVANTGWMIPYVACMIVATGMLAHFWTTLVRFLRRRKTDLATVGAVVSMALGGLPGIALGVLALFRTSAARDQRLEPPRKAKRPRVARPGGERLAARVLPWGVVGLAALFVVAMVLPPRNRTDKMNLDEFGKLPVVFQGRPKPFDTLARNSLRVIADSESFETGDGDGEHREPAVKWLLDAITDSPEATRHKVFRIENLDLLNALGLKRRQGYRYSIDEFRDAIHKFEDEVRKAHAKKSRDVDTYQKKLMEFDNRLHLYLQLLTAFRRPDIRTQADVVGVMRSQQRFAEMQLPLAVPPAPTEARPDGDDKADPKPWVPYAKGWMDFMVAKANAHANREGSAVETPNPATGALIEIFDAYEKGDSQAFNDAVAAYRVELRRHPPEGVNLSKIDFEAFFNRVNPFFWTRWFYVAAFGLTALGWLGWARPMWRSSLLLLGLTLAVHTVALGARIYISGRPPVTNLYSSAVFIGWGAVVLGLVMECIFRLGIGNAVAAVAGFSTLEIAYLWAGDGDTFTMLQAVLDTQFWLATHVTCITLGYTATYVAGLLGLIYVLAGVFTPALAGSVGKDVGRMLYGALCFAIFFSFVGTVLGGLWADDSWGRFWGWDPKENGALMIVLWNALVLHARWDGMARERGMAQLAVFGNVVVSWSWFGVNQLGAGLHAYGSTEGVMFALAVFVASQLAVIGIGWLPTSAWRSFRRESVA
ncbi:MAG TPA: cytochrome c biogenesis protein CcsA [Pirellulales bacterium]|nr:cytochrome c biogenesis protein CcsA [Pirellulales bacterium]